MKKHMKSLFYVAITAFGFSQIGLASLSQWSPDTTQEAGQQLEAPIMLAAGVGTRVERRHDVVDNTEDRVDDKQDFREERRDCTGDGPDCRSDNRQDKREDTVDRADDRIDDRQDRR
jgi:hypothetical protein